MSRKAEWEASDLLDKIVINHGKGVIKEKTSQDIIANFEQFHVQILRLKSGKFEISELPNYQPSVYRYYNCIDIENGALLKFDIKTISPTEKYLIFYIGSGDERVGKIYSIEQRINIDQYETAAGDVKSELIIFRKIMNCIHIYSSFNF